MKIKGMSSAELCELRLRLNSIDMNFECKFQHPVDTKSGPVEFSKGATACIEFRDSHEIDQLIDILQRFKRENRQYMGVW